MGASSTSPSRAWHCPPRYLPAAQAILSGISRISERDTPRRTLARGLLRGSSADPHSDVYVNSPRLLAHRARLAYNVGHGSERRLSQLRDRSGGGAPGGDDP